MRKHLFSIALSLLSLAVFSQASDIQVEWGPLMKAKDTDFSSIIGADDDFFYTFGQESKGLFSALSRTYHIKKYSRKNYKVEYDVVIDDFEYKGKNAYFTKAWILEGEVHLFFGAYNSQLDKKFMVERIINKKGKLSKPNEVASVPAERKSDGNFIIIKSKDSTKVLIYSDYPYEKRESEKFGVKVLDNEYNVIWERVVSLPYTDKYFTLTDQTITNDGDVFILGYSEPDRYKGEKKKRKESNEDYKVFRISQENEEILEYDLDLDKKYVNSASISADFGDNLMAIAGFYSEKKEGYIGGSFYITIHQKTLDAVTASSEPFGKDFMKNFMSDRKADKGKEVKNFVFRDFIRRDDGGAVVVAEQYYVTVVQHTNANGVTTTTYYYHYNHIMAININPDGHIEWTAHIPKFQVSTDDNGFYSGYMLLIEKSNLHFIFNDNRKNLDRIAKGKKLKYLGSPKKSIAIIATVDAKGDVTRDQLFNNKDLSAILVPKKSVQTNGDEVILFGIKRSKNRFGTLSFR